jgi:glycosyltransferase involved in cell wall biosynthesis
MSVQTHFAPVSVVLPCYRCTDTLRRAVDSVVAQSQLPSEVILVDDCSGDGTAEMLVAIAGAYAPGWIRIVTLNENKGAGSARNAGWAHSTQAYIAFLDADDAWHPEKIRIQLGYMLAHPDVALSGHAHRLIRPGFVARWTHVDAALPPKSRRLSKWLLLVSNRFVTPSAMVRREIPQRFEEGQRYMEDHMLWLSIAFAGGAVDRLVLPLAAIFKRPYGQAGLSSQLWLMERGDLGNYRRLFRRGQIARAQFIGLCALSFAKFIRRLVIHSLITNWRK